MIWIYLFSLFIKILRNQSLKGKLETNNMNSSK